jgi:hypothetical protein
MMTNEVLKQSAGLLPKANEGETLFEFDSDGFLTDRRRILESAISSAHDRLLKRARQINRDCHELIFAAPIHNRDPKEMLCATLFARVLEHYQATLLLLGTGLIAPAKVALRATIESVFATRAVAIDKEAWRAFINDDLFQRRKLIRRAQQHDHINLEGLREALTQEVIDHLEQQIEASGATPLKTEDLSKRAGMHEWYTTHYALLSKASHTNVRQLEAYLSLDESSEIRGVTYAPSMEEIPHLVLTAAHCILLAAEAVAGVFEIDFQAKMRDHLAFIEAGIRALNQQISSPPLRTPS